ncbi:adenylate/guanylate cyclase domain-containing protein [Nannocystis exedens]|uniref:adenylate/guanylate cyclase domain-containing protein n=1 Tax=Nannocystis exedens TaxID=54 RepID=UPI000BBA081D|nr:adenylate/guanylate cyclase domain-containing protein [Nannocystis exedens]
MSATGAYFALHVGDVFYGDIGGADRLDFTVIGPAVNEAARISAMCRPLGRDVLVSQAFAAALSGLQRRLSPMGSHTLRGIAQLQALFAVIPEPRRRDRRRGRGAQRRRTMGGRQHAHITCPRL